MTLVSTIIAAAFRETNITAVGNIPAAADLAELLPRLQNLVTSQLGNAAGELLQPLPLGRGGITTPPGYPWYGDSLPYNMFVPANTRLMLNLGSSSKVYLDAKPQDGERFAVTDTAYTLGTYPLTVQGNGRSIENAAFATLSDSGLIREWIYRNDTGNWARVTGLALTSDMPFPPEFDDMFITMLNMRMSGRYGSSLPPESQAILKMAKVQFKARYKQIIRTDSELALQRLNLQGGSYARQTGSFNGALFNSGYPFI